MRPGPSRVLGLFYADLMLPKQRNPCLMALLFNQEVSRVTKAILVKGRRGAGEVEAFDFDNGWRFWPPIF